MEAKTKKEKVSIDEINRLQKQKVEKNDFVDGVDGVDRCFGRLFSKLGQIIEESF